MKAKFLFVFFLAAMLTGCGDGLKNDHISGCDPNLETMHYPQKAVKRNAPAVLPKGIGKDAEFLVVTSPDGKQMKLEYYYPWFTCGDTPWSTCVRLGKKITLNVWATRNGIPMPCLCPRKITHTLYLLDNGEYTIHLQYDSKDRRVVNVDLSSETDTLYIFISDDASAGLYRSCFNQYQGMVSAIADEMEWLCSEGNLSGEHAIDTWKHENMQFNGEKFIFTNKDKDWNITTSAENKIFTFSVLAKLKAENASETIEKQTYSQDFQLIGEGLMTLSEHTVLTFKLQDFEYRWTKTESKYNSENRASYQLRYINGGEMSITLDTDGRNETFYYYQEAENVKCQDHEETFNFYSY
jgi:hypothetical protein